MQIFMTGATGYVGGHVLQHLLKKGHTVRCVVRNRSALKINVPQVEVVQADVTHPESLTGLMKNCDAVIHLIAIIQEKLRKGITFEKVNYQATAHLVNEAKRQCVRRFLHMSALGADPDGATPYFRTKGRAEQMVRDSGLDYTIFRPSFIFGPGDAVYAMLASILEKSPFGIMPVFGSGQYRHQPVSIHNVAQGFVAALGSPASIAKIFNVGGPQALSYNEQLDVIARVIGKRIVKIYQPLPLIRPLVALAGRLPFSPIDSDRLKMLIQDNVCDPDPFASELGIELIPFEDGLREYLAP